MVLGSKKLSHLITKFERGGGAHDDNEESPRRRKRLTPKSKAKQNVHDFEIGDKITLVKSPWKDCEGKFPCRVVRRPDFAESALVAFAGAAGARAVAQSSKQYLVVVDRHVVEFTKLNEVHGRVAFISSVDEIYKMRLRQDELIALFFKTGKEDPLILKCRACEIVSQQIRAARGSGLVKKEAIHKALHLIQEIQAKERALEYEPSLARVNEISALYDKAAEQFVIGGDARSKEILVHKQRFLELPKVASIQKGTPQKPKAFRKREPEILETSIEYIENDAIRQVDSDDLFGGWADFEKFEIQTKGDETNKSKEQNVDDTLFEARQDSDTFKLGNDLGSRDKDRDNGDTNGDSFAFAEFDAMMEAAERELDEIRNM